MKKNLKMLIFIVLVSSILIQLCLYTGYLNTKDYSSYGQQPKLKMWAEKLFSQIAPQTLQIIENFGSIFDGDLSSNLTWRFDFSYLTQRKFCYSYKEMTSFNPNGKNGDFSNAVEFAKGGLVLFEDYGSGVFQRLAMIHKLEKNDHVFFEIDGEELIEIPVFVNKSFNYPFPKIFLRLNDKGRNRAGLYVTHPISYAKSFRIIVRWPGSDHIETNTAWNESFVCRTTGALCKNVFYHSVISNKLAQGTEIKTHFKDYVSQQDLQMHFQ
ncbi:uncharacterized protein LOC124456576 isoform X1 [Xenia sp. Carnegie-2017]|uniref:uncharacterized protein LOC124456576 isoform X1 n=2 Tax=Xenia sp. Carnegie-2017 TaxID=2897299 RepID=UPI001F04FF85|nr:uncharacterized protein LOC124456576 isoform X1 [Xenia sp. Carnegie-2017]